MDRGRNLEDFRNISFDDMNNEEIVDFDGESYIYPFALKDSPYYKFLKAFTRHMSSKLQSPRSTSFLGYPMPDEYVYEYVKSNYKKFMEDFPDKDLLELASGGADPAHMNKVPFENIFFEIPDNGYMPNRSNDLINVLNEYPGIHGRNILGGRHRAIYMKYLNDLYSKKFLNRFEQALLWKIKNRYGDKFLPDNTLEVHKLNTVPNYASYPFFNQSKRLLNKETPLMARYILNGNQTDMMMNQKKLVKQNYPSLRNVGNIGQGWWNRTPLPDDVMPERTYKPMLGNFFKNNKEDSTKTTFGRQP